MEIMEAFARGQSTGGGGHTTIYLYFYPVSGRGRRLRAARKMSEAFGAQIRVGELVGGKEARARRKGSGSNQPIGIEQARVVWFHAFLLLTARYR